MFFDDSNSPIVNNKDSDTFQKITAILCEKRRILEETISKSTSEEKAGELLQLVEEMQTFGITEIDYQNYINSKK